MKYKLCELEIMKKPDIYLVSYPRSGRSWLRALYLKCFQLYTGRHIPSKIWKDKNIEKVRGELRRKNERLDKKTEDAIVEHLGKEHKFYLHSEKYYQANPELFIPLVKPTHDGQSMNLLESQVGTLKQRIEKYVNTPVLLLKRDPKDTVVSYFHYTRSSYGTAESRKLTWPEFMSSKDFGLPRIEKFYSIWDQAREILTVKEICYENLHRNTKGMLKDVLNWMAPSIEWKEEWIAVAVEFGKLENMSKIMLDGIDTFPQVRRGRVGDGEKYKKRIKDK